MTKIIDLLKDRVSKNKDLIADFFTKKFQENEALFYNSVDLRHSGFKIAPVDTNCFPAGFNNVNGLAFQDSKVAVSNFLKGKIKNSSSPKIMIIPENHTRNIRYYENIYVLQNIISADSNNVILGTMIEDIADQQKIPLENNNELILNSIEREGDYIKTKNGFIPDLIILNNDLTSGYPEIFKNLKIPIYPSPDLGWFKRAKSVHFSIYSDLAEELSSLIDIDSWLISSIHGVCNNVDFKNHLGLECLAKEVDKTILKLKEKYRQHNISENPYCYVKADNGTYGMAIMLAFSGQDILEINKKERNKMNSVKESTHTNSVLIQEGIKTVDQINKMSAEPMIYIINGTVVGNLYRANENKDQQSNLNSAGMHFFDLKKIDESQKIYLGGDTETLELVYSVIARLAALASSYELKKYQNDKI